MCRNNKSQWDCELYQHPFVVDQLQNATHDCGRLFPSAMTFSRTRNNMQLCIRMASLLLNPWYHRLHLIRQPSQCLKLMPHAKFNVIVQPHNFVLFSVLTRVIWLGLTLSRWTKTATIGEIMISPIAKCYLRKPFSWLMANGLNSKQTAYESTNNIEKPLNKRNNNKQSSRRVLLCTNRKYLWIWRARQHRIFACFSTFAAAQTETKHQYYLKNVLIKARTTSDWSITQHRVIIKVNSVSIIFPFS